MQAQSRPVGVAYGECWCGCGGKTRIPKYTRSDRPEFAGEPVRYIHGHHRRKSGELYREEDRGHVTPCWIWQRGLDSKGYGTTAVRGHFECAHRWMYEQHNDPLAANVDLDHLCRVPACVRPTHLDPVTHAENCRRGAWTKLTWEAVAIIRATPEVRGSGAALARRFGVSENAIYSVRRGRTWVAE